MQLGTIAGVRPGNFGESPADGATSIDLSSPAIAQDPGSCGICGSECSDSGEWTNRHQPSRGGGTWGQDPDMKRLVDGKELLDALRLETQKPARRSVKDTLNTLLLLQHRQLHGRIFTAIQCTAICLLHYAYSYMLLHLLLVYSADSVVSPPSDISKLRLVDSRGDALLVFLSNATLGCTSTLLLLHLYRLESACFRQLQNLMT